MTLLDQIERYQRAFRVSDSGFGKQFGDNRLVQSIRGGRNVKPELKAKIMSHIATEVARFRSEYP